MAALLARGPHLNLPCLRILMDALDPVTLGTLAESPFAAAPKRGQVKVGSRVVATEEHPGILRGLVFEVARSLHLRNDSFYLSE